MRTFYKLIPLILLTFIFTNAYPQLSDNWMWLNPKPQGNTINSLDFVNDSVGYGAGQFGTIMKTTDNGLTWAKLNTLTTSNFGALDFINENTGYAGGQNQMLIKTTDGGYNWNSIALPPAEFYYIYDIQFLNENTGYVLGFFQLNSIIWKTTDAGQSWSTIENTGANYLWKLHFLNEDLGFAAGGSLYGEVVKTTNGGLNWTLLDYNEYPVYSINFRNELEGFLGCEEGRIYKTTDGGQTWNFRWSDGSIDVHSMNFLNDNTAFGFGTGSVYIKTTNGGENWYQSESIGASQSSQYYDAEITPNGTIYAAGTTGAMVRSTNGGQTFEFDSSVTDEHISDIKFLDANTGYAVCGYSGGDILKTTNGGINWVSQITAYIPPVYGISFTDDQTGYLAGSVTIYKTTNGGTNWTVNYSSPSEIYTDVFFTTPNTGYVVGSYGRLLKTTNAGASWSPSVIPGQGTMISSIFFTNEFNGYIVGDNRMASRTIDGGTTWTPMSVGPINFVNFNNIFFSDPLNGYISAGDGIYKTIDGGASWFQLNTPEGGYSNVQFRGQFGYAVTSGGKIIKSSDAGINWIVQPTVTSNGLSALFFNIDNFVYAGGLQGTLMKTIPTEFILTSVGEPAVTAVPENFSLSQNYPNPFNPSTKIDFNLTKAGNVSLKIFDLSGREIATLINEYRNAGTYTASFNASQLSSGIYFYKLTSNGSSLTKKMMLLK